MELTKTPKTIPEGKICDYIDGKFRSDTPEEYVRQTLEKRLVNEHKYLPSQISVEYPLQVFSNRKRADIVVFEKDCASKSQNDVKIIIECKKESVEPKNRKDGVDQLKGYMSVCPNCEWGLWTNGRQKEVYRKIVDSDGNILFDDYNDIPPADGNIKEVDRPQRGELRGHRGTASITTCCWCSKPVIIIFMQTTVCKSSPLSLNCSK